MNELETEIKKLCAYIEYIYQETLTLYNEYENNPPSVRSQF